MAKGLKKQDWRKSNLTKHEPHLSMRWFHWSWRPRIVLCYYHDKMGEQRCMSLDWRKWHD